MSDGRPLVRMRIERKSWHPWVFQKMVDFPPQRVPPGSVVEIEDAAGRWVGRGFFNAHSRIALRVMTDQRDEMIDGEFFKRKITRAVHLRREMLRLDDVTDAYRVVHSEGDGLSGLVVDRFAGAVVLEFFAAGMWRFREDIQAALSEHYPGAKFHLSADEHVRKQESFEFRQGEPLPPETITEHGVKFRVVPGGKHKTGFFADQRDNRRRVASMSVGKRVLDLCCNSGGFGVHAKVAGADEVTCLDLDDTALALARQNAGINGVRIKDVQSDLFPWLRDAIGRGLRWDVVVLDPAKQTRDREEIPLALKKYLDMNRLALQAVADGGTFATFSCTGLVSEADFIDALRRAAWQAGKQLQLIHVGGAGGDHPVMMHAPESRYLKAVFARVFPAMRLEADRRPEPEGAPGA